MFVIITYKQSNVVSLSGLYSRGGVYTPARIRMPVILGGDLKSNFLRILWLLGHKKFIAVIDKIGIADKICWCSKLIGTPAFWELVQRQHT